MSDSEKTQKIPPQMTRIEPSPAAVSWIVGHTAEGGESSRSDAWEWMPFMRRI